jgi:hypothetical protein
LKLRVRRARRERRRIEDVRNWLRRSRRFMNQMG